GEWPTGAPILLSENFLLCLCGSEFLQRGEEWCRCARTDSELSFACARPHERADRKASENNSQRNSAKGTARKRISGCETKPPLGEEQSHSCHGTEAARHQ